MPNRTPPRRKELTRGELAAQTGCNIETIRYYEQIRLLPPPPRSQAGHRLYGDDLRKRLGFIRRSRELGFTLDETRGLLCLVDGGNYTCAQVEALAREHVREIERKISDLKQLKRALETMASQCKGGTIPSCPIIDALFDPGTRLRGATPWLIRRHKGEIDDKSCRISTSTRNLAKGFFEQGRQAVRIREHQLAASDGAAATVERALDSAKFRDPFVTAKGERRAAVSLRRLRTLWFNTGTLCNLTCRNCYIESSPTNDRLVYLSAVEVAEYLDEIECDGLGTEEIGFTGGEPFMNPAFPAMLEEALRREYRVLVLTNAMRPMMKMAKPLLALKERYPQRLVVRISLDHYSRSLHELERGPRSWVPAFAGLKWLIEEGFIVHVAGRRFSGEPDSALRAGYARLFREHRLPVDAHDPVQLVLFPEMDATKDVPEITTACWDILGVSPDAMMCASSRMVVKRKGAPHPTVVSCTLLPYDPQFELGRTLREASGSVPLNHPHCARFCVLGGGSCTANR